MKMKSTTIKIMSAFLMFFISVISYAQPASRSVKASDKLNTKIDQKKLDKSIKYRVGIIANIPVNVATNYKIDIGSTFFEVSKPITKKIDVVGNFGFLRFRDGGINQSTQIPNQWPIMGGARCFVFNNLYFGASAGASFYQTQRDARFIYSAHLGYKYKKLSLDYRYINWWKSTNIENVTALVASYSF